jgi:hypothetical protein
MVVAVAELLLLLFQRPVPADAKVNSSGAFETKTVACLTFPVRLQKQKQQQQQQLRKLGHFHASHVVLDGFHPTKAAAAAQWQ